MEKRLAGKKALVTGASRGIGRAIALKLASEGADVAVNYNGSAEKAEETAAEIRTYGVKALVIQADVSDQAAVERMFSALMQEFGRLDILVNNAGITKDGLLIGMKEDQFARVVDINLKGCFYCLQLASRLMLKEKSGRIINLASYTGVHGNAGQVNYAASKAGIIGMTKSAAKELGSRGITVNAVAPGFIETDMTEQLSDRVKEAVNGMIPLKKFGKPEDVANAVAFLAGEEARYITGEVLAVDGGLGA